jgi:hypothetical protein
VNSQCTSRHIGYAIFPEDEVDRLEKCLNTPSNKQPKLLVNEVVCIDSQKVDYSKQRNIQRPSEQRYFNRCVWQA